MYSLKLQTTPPRSIQIDTEGDRNENKRRVAPNICRWPRTAEPVVAGERLGGDNDNAVDVHRRPHRCGNFEDVRSAREAPRAQGEDRGDDERRIHNSLDGEHRAKPDGGFTEERVDQGAVMAQECFDEGRRPRCEADACCVNYRR